MDSLSTRSLVENQNLARLGEAMSAISERCYCAGWLGGTEYLVPELCRRAIADNLRQPWGHGFVSSEEARQLAAIAETLGHWADLNDTANGYDPFEPFPIPDVYIKDLDYQLTIRKS